MVSLKHELNVKQELRSKESIAFVNRQRRLRSQEESRADTKLKASQHLLEKHGNAFRVSRQYLTHRTKEATSTLADWRKRLENEVNEQTDKLETLQRDREILGQKLRNVEEQLERETAAKNARIEHHRRKVELERMMKIAVVRMQAAARGFLVRSRMRKQKEDAKKKGKGKGKGKGKKGKKKK